VLGGSAWLIGGEGVEDAGREGGSGEDGVDAGEGFGDGALDGGGEGMGEGERLSADGEEEGAFGDVIVKLITEAEEERGRAGVCEQGVRFVGKETDGFTVDEAGREAGGGIEKDGEVAVAERFGEFGGPLLGSVDSDPRAGELIAEETGKL
jgi:hypothetical protein